MNRACEALWSLDRSVVLGSHNILESKQVRERGLRPFLERAYSGECVSVPPYAFDASSEPASGGGGRERWLFTTAYPIRNGDGQVRGIVLLSQDLTDQRRTDELAGMLKASIDNIGTPAYWFGVDNLICYANRAAAEALGYELGELVGLPLSSIAPRATPENLVRVWELIRGGAVFRAQTIHRRKDGSEFPAEIQSSLSVYGGREFCCGFATDISDRKKAEAAFEQAQKLNALEAVAGSLAHDMNNIMGGVLGYIDMAREAADPALSASFLDKALKSVDRARALNSRFLTFSKGGGPDKRSHPLHPFIREAVELALASADIRCTFRLPADLPPCEYDRNQLHQVIENLVLNARQAMHGRGTLLVSADTVELAAYQVQGLAGGRFIAVRVADSGPGIPPEVLPRIFEPFFTTKAEGNGLGLASSLSIMRKHGGTLTAENLDTGGCAFTLYLPTG